MTSHVELRCPDNTEDTIVFLPDVFVLSQLQANDKPSEGNKNQTEKLSFLLKATNTYEWFFSSLVLRDDFLITCYQSTELKHSQFVIENKLSCTILVD